MRAAQMVQRHASVQGMRRVGQQRSLGERHGGNARRMRPPTAPAAPAATAQSAAALSQPSIFATACSPSDCARPAAVGAITSTSIAAASASTSETATSTAAVEAHVYRAQMGGQL